MSVRVLANELAVEEVEKRIRSVEGVRATRLSYDRDNNSVVIVVFASIMAHDQSRVKWQIMVRLRPYIPEMKNLGMGEILRRYK